MVEKDNKKGKKLADFLRNSNENNGENTKKSMQSNNEVVIRLLLQQEKSDDPYVKTQETHYVG